ncbi:hypothetical protein V7056_10830 [Bacillus sp. JJ664]
MKGIQNYKRILPIVIIGLLLVISVGSVYANTDIKKQFDLWGNSKTDQAKSTISKKLDVTLRSNEDNIDEETKKLLGNTTKEIEDSAKNIQDKVENVIQSELEKNEKNMSTAFQSNQGNLDQDFDSINQEVKGKTTTILDELYEDSNILPNINSESGTNINLETAKEQVEIEVNKTKETISKLKVLAQNEKDSFVKQYILEKIIFLEMLIEKVEK